MPSENAEKRLPPDALDAFLDGILAELREPTDPAALNEIRAAFRKRVPLSLRSYAAAALILRAAGLSRTPGRPGAKEAPMPALKGKKPSAREPRHTGRDAGAKSEGKIKEVERGGLPSSRPRYVGDGLTLFFSMGKRQRLYPRILIDLLIDVAGLAPEAIGEVRAFDNYSFVDIDPQKSESVISALNGYDFRGRKLSVGPAKKRDGQAVAD
ncbi:MAG: DbpA RNA binding domain-containing protein [Rectinemataceae bacterium]